LPPLARHHFYAHNARINPSFFSHCPARSAGESLPYEFADCVQTAGGHHCPAGVRLPPLARHHFYAHNARINPSFFSHCPARSAGESLPWDPMDVGDNPEAGCGELHGT